MTETPQHPTPTETTRKPRMSGWGRVLVAVYGILAVAALGRSIFQIIDHFSTAPVAFSLSALSGVVYVVATLALALQWRRLAWATIGFELVGVVVIGTLSFFWPSVLGITQPNPFVGDDATVWSWWGAGYVFIPLALPILGLVWLGRSRRAAVAAKRS